jgi:hypothetical protein
MHRLLARALALLVLLSCAACNTTKPFVPKDPYPTRGEVEALEAEPVPEVTIKEDGLVVERWALAGPFPEMIGAQPHNPIGPVQEIASGFTGGATVTAQMTCAARELGRFVIEEGEQPSAYISSFIMTRCGATSHARTITLRWHTWEVPADDGVERDEGVLARRDFDTLREMSREVGEREDAELGAWFGRGADGRAHAFFASARRLVEIEPVARTPGRDGEVLLKGKVLGQAHHVWAVIGKGDTGWESCTSDPRVEAPRFEIRCPTTPGDARARFSIGVVRRRTSPFSTPSLVQTIWPTGELPDAFVSTGHQQFASTLEVSGEVGSASFPEEFVGMVNALRARHDLPPLLHSISQTRTVQRLTPRMYESNEDLEQERILKSMLAGWGIANGEIVDSGFSGKVVPVDDPRVLLAELADNPSGRKVLFQPGRGVLALGTLSGGGSAYVVVCSYSFLEDEPHRARIARVQRTINRARKLAGKGKMRRYKNFYALADELAADVTGGAREPIDAAKTLARKVRHTLNDSVYYNVYYVSDLDRFRPPPDLVESDKVHGAIMVTPYRAEGQRYTRYFIVVVYPQRMSASYEEEK